MGYHGKWNATEASPQRAVDSGLIDRFGSIDKTDGGHTYRYSIGGEWQRGDSNTLTKITAYGLGYDLDLISNFTFFLDDPVHGDQREQVDHRFVTGVKASQRRLAAWGSRPVQNTFGIQFRNDNIPEVGLYHTEARVRLETRSRTPRLVTSAGVYGQNEIEWAPGSGRTLGASGRRLALSRRRARSAEQRHGDRRHRQPEGRRRRSDPGRAPSSTSTPAPAFTATTRSARRLRVRR